MFHGRLDDIGRGCGYDHSQQCKPGHPGLIKITDAEEPHDVGKEGGAEEPEIPLFISVSFDRLSSRSDPGEANVDQSQEADERCQTT